MPCTDMNAMLDALAVRVVDPRKIIAQVHGAGQVGTKLWISGLNEKLWISDTMYVGMWGFSCKQTYDPSEEPIEIEIHPAIIPSGNYRNIGESFANGASITRGPAVKDEVDLLLTARKLDEVAQYDGRSFK